MTRIDPNLLVSNLIILAMGVTLGLVGSTLLNKPVCDDLVRYPADQSHQLVCELGLGDIPEDQADVRIR